MRYIKIIANFITAIWLAYNAVNKGKKRTQPKVRFA